MLGKFLKLFNAEDVVLMDDVVQIKEFYFTLTLAQKDLLSHSKPIYIGYCLGKKKGQQFCPSICLLDFISGRYEKQVVVDAKTEWLFVCGRDIFSVTCVKGNPSEGDLVLVMNQHQECIGIASYAGNPSKKTPIKHVYDIGDYLRRERTRKLKS